MNQLMLAAQPLNQLFTRFAPAMIQSTQEFIELMEMRYGPAERVGRGNILNFGGQITLAIGNSRLHRGKDYFYAVQDDFLTDRLRGNREAPLGVFAALICADEQTVLLLPQALLVEAMGESNSERFNIVSRDGRFHLRTTGKPLIDVTEHLNRYPAHLDLIESVTANNDTECEEFEAQRSDVREHTRVQWMLIQFGLAAECSVWVPAGDRGKEFGPESFSSLTIAELPNFGFDAVTRQIVSNIDVLWLEGNTILKAFEIEATTLVYTGLLRISDLVLSQPNISIDLHIVAPLRRRETVRRNVLRPSFARLRSKCSYISFEEVTRKYEMVRELLAQQKTVIRGLLDSEIF